MVKREEGGLVVIEENTIGSLYIKTEICCTKTKRKDRKDEETTGRKIVLNKKLKSYVRKSYHSKEEHLLLFKYFYELETSFNTHTHN